MRCQLKKTKHSKESLELSPTDKSETSNWCCRKDILKIGFTEQGANYFIFI